MIRDINQFSAFDILSICRLLQDPLGGITRVELHYVTYLSCILSLYDGSPYADWGYEFVSTDMGTPFSEKIDSDLSTLSQLNYLNVDSHKYTLTEPGASLIKDLEILRMLNTREKYLESSCNSMLSLPSNYLRNAMRNEPNIKSSVIHASTSLLLDKASPSSNLLYEHFDLLRKTLGPSHYNLIIPSITWLRFLNEYYTPE